VKFIKNVVIGIWVCSVAAAYFIILFLIGLAVLIYSELEEYFKKRLDV